MYFKDVVKEMKRVGIKMLGNKLKGFYVSSRDMNMLQVIFLDSRIALIVSDRLSKYGTEVRDEFLKANTHPYSIILDRRQYENLPKAEQDIITTQYQEEAVMIELIGLGNTLVPAHMMPSTLKRKKIFCKLTNFHPLAFYLSKNLHFESNFLQ